MNTITTIAFDFGGVLARKIEDEYLCHMAHAAGADPERFIPALWEHRDKYDAGELDAPSYWREVMENSGVGIGSAEAVAETVTTLIHLDALGWGTIQPSMVRWLTTLRSSGYGRIIISNMSVEMRGYLIRETSLMRYFDDIIISGEIGINKPDERIFKAASERVGTPLEQMLFIDDLAPNVAGARAAGMQALQFTDPAALARDLEGHFPDIPLTGLTCP